MTTREWRRLSRPLAEALPEFREMRLGFVRMHDWVAECIYADRSQLDKTAFRLELFALPLFIPTDDLYFAYGFQIDGWWSDLGGDRVGAVREALPGLAEIAGLEGLERLALEQPRDPHRLELRLCLAALRRDQVDFDECRGLVRSSTPEAEWAGRVLERCREVESLVGRGGWAAAQAEFERRREDVTRLVEEV